jgi:hypothetical protein
MIAAPDLRVIRYRIIRVAVAPPALLARLPVVPRRQRGCHLYIAATARSRSLYILEKSHHCRVQRTVRFNRTPRGVFGVSKTPQKMVLENSRRWRVKQDAVINRIVAVASVKAAAVVVGWRYGYLEG